MDSEEQKRILASLDDELNGVTLYEALAKAEKDPRLSEVYHRMAAVEQRHANIWTEKLKAAGVKVPPYHPSWRTRTFGWFAHRFGASTVLPSVMSLEQADTQKYSQVAENQLICLVKETSL